MLILRNQPHTIAQTAGFLKSTLFHSFWPTEAKEKWREQTQGWGQEEGREERERMRRLNGMWKEEKGEGEGKIKRKEGEEGFDGGHKIEIKLLQIFLLKTINYDNWWQVENIGVFCVLASSLFFFMEKKNNLPSPLPISFMHVFVSFGNPSTAQQLNFGSGFDSLLALPLQLWFW